MGKSKQLLPSHQTHLLPRPSIMPPPPPYERRMDTIGSDGPAKKRRKGATRLSCAECRRYVISTFSSLINFILICICRLKLRCDRAIPCSSCVKRGCGPICPDVGCSSYTIRPPSHYIIFRDLLQPAKEIGKVNGLIFSVASGLQLPHRFVLASTQELHEKISELATRVRELEDALRSSHSHLTSEQHPLLTEELLKIKAPLQRDISHTKSPSSVVIKEEETNPDIIDSFGSLSISLTGRTKYFGQTANSWVSKFCTLSFFFTA